MQRIPGHRTGDGEGPTTERAATMSWYDKMVAYYIRQLSGSPQEALVHY